MYMYKVSYRYSDVNFPQFQLTNVFIRLLCRVLPFHLFSCLKPLSALRYRKTFQVAQPPASALAAAFAAAFAVALAKC